MILIKTNTNYVIRNQSENANLNGSVILNGGEIAITAQVFSTNNQRIASCSYKYRRGGACDKVIGNCNHQYISTVEQLLEDTLSFLIEQFNL